MSLTGYESELSPEVLACVDKITSIAPEYMLESLIDAMKKRNPQGISQITLVCLQAALTRVLSTLREGFTIGDEVEGILMQQNDRSRVGEIVDDVIHNHVVDQMVKDIMKS